MAGLVSPLLKMGFRILGGCCGTTPGHLRAMAEAMPKR
jgi:methionine synthase I (cobalamin-dependent)